MKRFLLALLLMALLIGGCSGTGFDKKTTLVPDSVSLGMAHEQYKSDRGDQWWGFTATATWNLK